MEPRHKREVLVSGKGHKEHCGVRGVGPGYAKSHLDYAGHFKGGARQFLPIYKKVHGSEHEVVVKGGCGAHDHPEHVPEHEEHEMEPRHKRGVLLVSGEGHKENCGVRGVGPGYAKSHLDYAGHFKGGARQFLPIYKKAHSSEHEVVVKGGCGARDHPEHVPEHEQYEMEVRHKRGIDGGHEMHKEHHVVKGVGPGYERSYLVYAGHFKGGARKFLPIYKRVKGEQTEKVIKGGCGAHDHPEHEEHEMEPRHKREVLVSGKGHKEHCGVRGVGPGYAKSHLDYSGHFKGGARKFLPIYKKIHGSEHEVIIKGGRGAHDHPEHEDHEMAVRHKRGIDIDSPTCGCICGCGPQFKKGHPDYRDHFKGGPHKFLPMHKKMHGWQHDDGGKGRWCGDKPCDHHHGHPRPHHDWEEKHKEHY
ncbi:hypothetical protein M514_04098 [Trichuris suis]|uniref:Uncharacterized protein n=1 Tax=Trichuris suis TaxID=68888 RepID=A0A085NFZ9_9BILA|nr:hypothetical protein M514_04098 [Trichuris suis]